MYELSEEEQVEVLARIITRDHEEGWACTHAPASTVDVVHLNNASAKASKKGKHQKGTGSPELDGFNSWATR